MNYKLKNLKKFLKNYADYLYQKLDDNTYCKETAIGSLGANVYAQSFILKAKDDFEFVLQMIIPGGLAEATKSYLIKSFWGNEELIKSCIGLDLIENKILEKKSI